MDRHNCSHNVSQKFKVSGSSLTNRLICELVRNLSGMFRRSASLAIPYRKSFAAIIILSISLVNLGHTNCNESVSHESQREIALV